MGRKPVYNSVLIIQDIKAGLSKETIVKKYGISLSTLSNIKKKIMERRKNGIKR